MFRDREDAARLLARRLKGRPFRDPLILAIPRGGVVTGVVLARELGAELDVVLSRKLRAPYQPELAVGAVGEDGGVYLNQRARDALDVTDEYLAEERRRQLGEIARRQAMFRGVRPEASLAGRSVIVTDDGIATGATMIAALQVARAKGPHELIVAVPVAPLDRLDQVRLHCDEVICLLTPADFWAVGQFYLDFAQVEDSEVVELLRGAGPAPQPVPHSGGDQVPETGHPNPRRA
jgi:putative phosphoribosyl transferase